MPKSARVILAVLLLLLLAAAGLQWLQPRISLADYQSQVDRALTSILGAPVSFDPDIYLTLSLTPVIELSQFTAGNPAQKNLGYIAAERVSAGIKLLSLFDDLVDFTHVEIAGVEMVNLYSPTTEMPLPQPAPPATLGYSLHDVRLTDARYLHIDAARELRWQVSIEELTGDLPWYQSVQLQMKGRFRGQPFNGKVSLSPLRQLTDAAQTAFLDIDADFVGVDIHYQLHDEVSRASATLSVSAESVSQLREFSGLYIPFEKPVRIDAELLFNDTEVHAKTLQLVVGKSHLAGELRYTAGDRSTFKVDLFSSHINLPDFVITDWREISLRAQDEEQVATELSVFSEQVLSAFDLDLTVKVQEVAIIDEVFGNAELHLTVDDGIFSLHRFSMQQDEASIYFFTEIKPEAGQYYIATKADLHKVDYGVLLDLIDPTDTNKGLLDLELEFAAVSPSLERVMSHANGRVSLAVWPEALDAEEFDLWAVDLLAVTLSQYQSQSKVNCAAGKFSLSDGILTEETLFLDTEQMRVRGKGAIDLKARKFQLVLAPRAKKKAFISAAMPVVIKGTFDEMDYAIRGRDLTKMILRNTANFALLGIPVLFQKTLPKDGSAACYAVLDASDPR